MSSNSEKKRVAHIGNLANTCLQGASKLPPDDYVFSILDSMNTTLTNSEKRVISFQQLQEFRSTKPQTTTDKDSEPSTSSVSQNDGSYSNKQRKKLLPSKVYPLMAKCQKNLKYLKHNRCIPKPRAHVGFVPLPAKEKILKKPTEILEEKSPCEKKILNNISNKVKRKKDNSEKLKVKKCRISKDGHSDFDNNSFNRSLPSKKKSARKCLTEREANLNPPSEKISDMESEDEFEKFIRKHNPPSRSKKKRVHNFSSDSDGSISYKKNPKAKISKKSQSSKEKDVKVTASCNINRGALKSGDLSKSQTKELKNKTSKSVVSSVLSKRTKKRSIILPKSATDSSDDDIGGNCVNDFDPICDDDSSNSMSLTFGDESNIKSVRGIPSVNNFTRLSDNFEKEDGLPSASSIPAQASLTMNSNKSKIQSFENIDLMPCSVLLKRDSVSESMNIISSSDKACSNRDNCNKTSVIHSENYNLNTVSFSPTESITGIYNSDFSCNSERTDGNVKVLNLHANGAVLSENLTHSNNLKINRNAKENCVRSLNNTLTSENSLSNNSRSNLNSKSNMIEDSFLRTKVKSEEASSESDDCVILDDFPNNPVNKSLNSELSHVSLLENSTLPNRKNSKEICTSAAAEKSHIICTSSNEVFEFNVKILSVHSLGDLNPVPTTNSSDDNTENQQLNTETTEPPKKLSDSIEIIDLELVPSPSKKEEKELSSEPKVSSKHSLLSNQLTETLDIEKNITQDTPVLQNIQASTKSNSTSHVLNNHCDRNASLEELSRKKEQSKVQILKGSVDNSSKNQVEDPKSFTLSVRTDSMSDDCIIIDDVSSVCSISDNHDQSSKIDSPSVSGKNLTDKVEPDENFCRPVVAVKNVNDFSFSDKSDDCIIIDDDDDVSQSPVANNDKPVKDNSDYISDNTIKNEEPLKTLDETIVKYEVNGDNFSKDKFSMKSDNCLIINKSASISDSAIPSDAQTVEDNSAHISDKASVEKIEQLVVKNLSKLSAVSEIVNDDSLVRNKFMKLDDCVVIADESPSLAVHVDAQTAKSNYSTDISNTIVAENVETIKNSSLPSEVSKDFNDKSLNKDKFSIKSDDCIIIDDELESATVNSAHDIAQAAKEDSSISPNKSLSEELKPVKKIGDPSVQSLNTNCFPSSTSSIKCECIVIDDDEIISPTASSNSGNRESNKISQVKNSEHSLFATRIKNSTQKGTSAKIMTQPIVTRKNSSTFKPDRSPHTPVVDILKAIDFDQIKKILNEKSSDGCVENNSLSRAVINIKANNICHANESLKLEAKFSKNTLLSENVKDEGHSDVLIKNVTRDKISSESYSLRSSELADVMDVGESKNKINLEPYNAVSYSQSTSSEKSTTEYEIHACIKIEKNCSEVVEMSDDDQETKRKNTEFHTSRNLELKTDLPLKPNNIPFYPNTSFSYNSPKNISLDTLKDITVYEKPNLDLLTSVSLNHGLKNTHNPELSVSKSIKPEVSIESTSDELDIFAATSIQGLNDTKQTDVIRLLDLYKEECKKYQEIKRTGRNLSAGLNLLHVKQVEKLRHIQSSIKNILKYDPCFHKLLKDVGKNQSMKSPEEKQKKSFQTPGPSSSATIVEAARDGGTAVKDPEDLKVFNSSVVENVQNAITSSHSTDTRDKMVYKQRMNIKCALCGKPAKLACQGCMKVYYCSPECGVISWNKNHYLSCGT